MESLLELYLASLLLGYLYLGKMVQGLYVQSPFLQILEWVLSTPVLFDS